MIAIGDSDKKIQQYRNLVLELYSDNLQKF